MSSKFKSFVVFAEMRTGSNFLESNLNAFDGITCHGEAFNPHFIGYPKSTEILGIDQQTRDNDPTKLLVAIRDKTKGIGGEYLNTLQRCEALLLVARSFEDPSIAHVDETVDPYRDAATLELELAFSDLAILERREDRGLDEIPTRRVVLPIPSEDHVGTRHLLRVKPHVVRRRVVEREFVVPTGASPHADLKSSGGTVLVVREGAGGRTFPFSSRSLAGPQGVLHLFRTDRPVTESVEEAGPAIGSGSGVLDA